MILELTINTPTITPCSENYHAMHPVTGGVFCDHCQKKVHDVSHMGAHDLHAFKTQFPEACVRMSATALKPVISYSTMHMSKQSSLHRFAFALFIIFGTFLFSCSEEEYTDTLKQIENLATSIQQENTSPVAIVVATAVDAPIQEEKHALVIKHNCVCVDLEAEAANAIASSVDTTTIELDAITIRSSTKQQTSLAVGLLVYTTVNHVVQLDTIINELKTVEAAPNLELGAYPNPAMYSATISYTLEQDAPIILHIYNMQGQLIQEIENNFQKPAGTYTEQISVTSWDAGLYPIILISGETRKTFMLSVKH